jgi:hypothetical protein
MGDRLVSHLADGESLGAERVKFTKSEYAPGGFPVNPTTSRKKPGGRGKHPYHVSGGRAVTS